MGLLLGIVYCIWAVYAGRNLISGRIEWLEEDAPLNRIVKFIVSFIVGYFLGAFYLIYWVVRFFFR